MSDRIIFDGKNHAEVAALMGIVNYDPQARGIHVDTPNGQVVAFPGDVIVCDDGEWRVE